MNDDFDLAQLEALLNRGAGESEPSTTPAHGMRTHSEGDAPQADTDWRAVEERRRAAHAERLIRQQQYLDELAMAQREGRDAERKFLSDHPYFEE